MAKTPVLHLLGASGANPYTVPAGKHLIANVIPKSSASANMLRVDGTDFISMTGGASLYIVGRGLVFPSGSVLTQSGVDSMVVSGFLYDN